MEQNVSLADTGERMIPTQEGEVSVVFARHRAAYAYARSFVEGKTVIDVGCGTGYGCALLAERAARVLGIDFNADAVAYSRTHYGAPNVQFEQADARTLARAERFDVAVSFQVIEHVADTRAFVERMKQVVKPGGRILISTPNVRTRKPAGQGNPFHVSEMNYAAFRDLMQQSFVSFEILGVGYARPNRLRRCVQKLPFYRLGVVLKRKSRLKKLASRTLDLTSFRILDTNVAEDAIDLLAVCRNEEAVREAG